MIVFMAMPSSCSIPSSDRAIIFPIVFPFSLPNLTSVQWEVLGEDRIVLLDYCEARRCYSVQGRSSVLAVRFEFV